MGKLLNLFFLFALLIREVKTDCACYQPTDFTGLNAPLSNAYDPSNFDTCYTPCSFVAYSGDDTFGWTNLTIRWGTPLANAGGVLKIYDGTSATGTPIIQLNEGEIVTNANSTYSIRSSSPRIFIQYTQTSSGTANTYYGSIKAGPGLQATTTPTTPMQPTTTKAYDRNTFSNDPSSITHDIMVVINKKTSGGQYALIMMNSIVTNFVNILPADGTNSSRTRLSLAYITPYDSYYSIQGGIWELSSQMLVASLTTNGVTTDGNIDQALTGLVQLAFKVNTNSSTDSRPNVQRSVVLVTGEWPSTGATLNADVQKTFDDYGVNLMVIGWNLDGTTTLFNPDRWYNAISATQTNSKAVASFVNPFYFNDKSTQNYWCPQANVYNEVDETGATNAYFSEPMNYAGPNGTIANSDWSKLPPYFGQTARYCNFANNQYQYKKPDNVATVKVTVFYELEAGKDNLSFYDAQNNLVASFTGYDINGGSFYSSSSVITAQFTSDNQAIYRGFFVNITPVS